MKKKFLKVSISIIILIIGMNVLYYNSDLDFIKKNIPDDFKIVLKKTIFYIPYLKKEIEKKDLKIDKIQKINKKTSTELIKLQQKRNIVNEKIFPQTQFIKLKYTEIKLDGLNSKKSYKRDGSIVSPFYIEKFEENLIIISKDTKIYSLTFAQLLNGINIKNEIQNNILKKDIEVTDVIIFENNIYLATHSKTKDCNNFTIYKGKMNLTNLEFEVFIELGKKGLCINSDGSKIDAIAGKMEIYNNGSSKGLLFSTRNPENKNYFIQNQYGDDLEYKYSALLFIDLKSKEIDVFASGFRNPQGLLVSSDNKILMTEHGPRGGDEINNIRYKKNYGWPMASYGENYWTNETETEEYEFKKNHADLGFEEPIYSFVPSIGISEIIELDNSFSDKWGKSFLLSSLRGGSLFRIIFDKNLNKILSMEKIYLQKRIRDLLYDNKNKVVFLAQENHKGSIGILENIK